MSVRPVSDLKITPARRRALVVCAQADDAEAVYQDPAVRISNRTDADRGHVYWQVARWLLRQQLVERLEESEPYVRLTDRGRQLIDSLGLGRTS